MKHAMCWIHYSVAICSQHLTPTVAAAAAAAAVAAAAARSKFIRRQTTGAHD